MAAETNFDSTPKTLIEEGLFKSSIPARNNRNTRWTRIYIACVALAAVALIILLLKIVDDAFGYIAIADVVDPATLVTADDRPLEEQTIDELAALIRDTTDDTDTFYVTTDRLLSVFLTDVAQTDASPGELRDLTLLQLLTGGQVFPAEWAERSVLDLRLPQGVDRAERETVARADLTSLLALNLDEGQLLDLVFSDIVQFDLKRTWNLIPSLIQEAEIQQIVAEQFPEARLEFYSWLNGQFLRSPSSNQALTAGIRVAVQGTIWVLIIAIGVSFPLGVGAAIYLEEYAQTASSNRVLRIINGFIETNIRNLAGVPSIIYGMLGLAVFVRVLEPLTSGRIVGVTGTDGRTIFSAGLTMALLILPVIIINAQEAVRAVPQSVREGSFGLGATKWQTIQRQVLPVALPGILTGVILSISRAIGETAPLVVVGAATTIFIDPSGPFSKFTVLPIQIYRWTADPRPGFQDAAAATIIVLLTLLIALNASAIVLRNYYSNKNRRLA